MLEKGANVDPTNEAADPTDSQFATNKSLNTAADKLLLKTPEAEKECSDNKQQGATAMFMFNNDHSFIEDFQECPIYS